MNSLLFYGHLRKRRSGNEMLFVEDIFYSFIIIFIFVVPCLHKHFRTGE